MTSTLHSPIASASPSNPPRFLITGGTGFIGKAVIHWLLSQKFSVTVWSRSVTKVQRLFGSSVDCVTDLSNIPTDQSFTAIINLAGERIVGKRWSNAQKQKLLASRVGLTNTLVDWMRSLPTPPKLLLTGSAIGYYGIQHPDDTSELTEQSPPQPIFMSELCQAWENSAIQAESFGTTVIRMRFGMILGKEGALPPMLLPIRFGVGGPLGKGNHMISWMHIHDVVGAIAWFCQRTNLVSGVYNFVAPEVVSQKTFIATAAQLLNRPSFFRTPGALVRTLLGEQSMILLEGQRVTPQRLLSEGYPFQYPTLLAALTDLVAKKSL